uniref:Putative zinc finger protein n=1 Tax=Ixodes ricinus TaxID=34613 RepID=A0A0K8R5N9_IXORI
MTGQKGIISKLSGAKVALEWLFTFVLLGVAKQLEPRARHGEILALGFFIAMESQVAHNYTPIFGHIGAETASKPDVFWRLLLGSWSPPTMWPHHHDLRTELVPFELLPNVRFVGSLVRPRGTHGTT